MRPTISLFRREFTAYFLSPIAYVVLAVFLLVTGHLFYLTMSLLTAKGPNGVEFPMTRMLGDEKFWLVFLFIPPLLTMRLFAEERSSGTLEMLMTAPVRDWQVVAAKFAACFGFFVLLWVPTLVYLPVLLDLGTPVFKPVWTANSLPLVTGIIVALCALAVMPFEMSAFVRMLMALLFVAGVATAIVGGYRHYTADAEHVLTIPAGIDPMPVLTAYLGLLLAGAMFLALGLFVSSLVKSQMVAALVTLILSLGFVVAAFWRPDMDASSPLYRVLYFFSVPMHFSRDFGRGIIDTRHVILYASLALFCLFLTVRSLESRRWR
jgi:ABC-2 type transport system permease protein